MRILTSNRSWSEVTWSPKSNLASEDCAINDIPVPVFPSREIGLRLSVRGETQHLSHAIRNGLKFTHWSFDKSKSVAFNGSNSFRTKVKQDVAAPWMNHEVYLLHHRAIVISVWTVSREFHAILRLSSEVSCNCAWLRSTVDKATGKDFNKKQRANGKRGWSFCSLSAPLEIPARSIHKHFILSIGHLGTTIQREALPMQRILFFASAVDSSPGLH